VYILKVDFIQESVYFKNKSYRGSFIPAILFHIWKK